jgi:hypothetical protein
MRHELKLDKSCRWCGTELDWRIADWDHDDETDDNLCEVERDCLSARCVPCNTVYYVDTKPYIGIARLCVDKAWPLDHTV